MAVSQPLSVRIFVTLFIAPFFLVSILLLVSPFRTVVGILWTQVWVPVDCVIQSSEVSEEGGLFGFEVGYRYTWSGDERESMHYAKGYEPSPNPREAEALSAQFPSGAEKVCFVNPMNPDQAALRRGNVSATASDLLLTLGAGILFFLPLAFSLFILHYPTPFQRLIREPRAFAQVVVLVLATGSILVGAITTVVFVWNPASQLLEARAWTATDCEITRSKVIAREATYRRDRHHPGPRTASQTIYGLDLAYTYQVGEHAFTGNRYRFFSHSAGQAANQTIAGRFPVGTTTTCYVSPEDPSEAVLERTAGLEVLWALLPLLFLLAGILLAWWAHRHLSPGSAESSGLSPSQP